MRMPPAKRTTCNYLPSNLVVPASPLVGKPDGGARSREVAADFSKPLIAALGYMMDVQRCESDGLRPSPLQAAHLRGSK